MTRAIVDDGTDDGGNGETDEAEPESEPTIEPADEEISNVEETEEVEETESNQSGDGSLLGLLVLAGVFVALKLLPGENTGSSVRGV